jgi:hypothetical protein
VFCAALDGIAIPGCGSLCASKTSLVACVSTALSARVPGYRGTMGCERPSRLQGCSQVS